MADEPRDDPDVLVPSVVGDGEGGGELEEAQESIESPGKVMRIGSMIKQLLEEVRAAELDQPSRERLREIYDTSITELSGALSPDLAEELARITTPFDEGEPPTGPELRIAKAQLVGWLEGLFHGIQATLFAQQMVARQQLEMHQRGLPPGAAQAMQAQRGQGAPGEVDQRPGTYL